MGKLSIDTHAFRDLKDHEIAGSIECNDCSCTVDIRMGRIRRIQSMRKKSIQESIESVKGKFDLLEYDSLQDVQAAVGKLSVLIAAGQDIRIEAKGLKILTKKFKQLIREESDNPEAVFINRCSMCSELHRVKGMPEFIELGEDGQKSALEAIISKHESRINRVKKDAQVFGFKALSSLKEELKDYVVDSPEVIESEIQNEIAFNEECSA